MSKFVALYCAMLVAIAKVEGLNVAAAPRPIGQPPLLDTPSRLLPLGANDPLLPRSIDPSASAVTLNKYSENNGDGNFRYGFESSNGIKTEQVGILKGPDPENPEGSQAVQGSYSYISPEGIPITVNYIADENGFRAVGDHIPTSNIQGNNVDAIFNSHLRPAHDVLASPEILRNGLRGFPNFNQQFPYHGHAQQSLYQQNYNLGRFAPNPYQPLVAGQLPHPGIAYNRGIGGAGFPNRLYL